MGAERGFDARDSPSRELSGLDDAAVAERRAAGMVNIQPHGTNRTVLQIVRSHLLTLFNLILGACGLALILLGRWLDLVFLVAAVANVIIGIVQEVRAKRKLERLSVLRRDPVRALRAGSISEVLPEDLVLDDIVLLGRGDQVPADGTLLSSRDLDLDESLLTGESDPVPKDAGDQALSGSSVVSGSGALQLTRVGPSAHAVQLTREARRFSRVGSELRTALGRVARWVSIALVPMAAVVLNGQMQAAGGWAGALESGAWRDAVVAAVASVTIMVPQGLALLSTLSFAVAAARLARGQVLVEELDAVEVLARVDVLCLDKTGTLTESGVRLEDVIALAGDADDGAWRRALAWFGADPDANATARALAERFTEPPASAPAAVVPFASSRRWSAVAFDGGAAPGAWVLGAPEVLLGDRHPAAMDRSRETASRGLRTMVICSAGALPAHGLPKTLEPHAIVTFSEKVRPDAAETLAYFREQGVQLKVLSGDHPRTVAATARAVGLAVGEAVDASTLPEDPAAMAEALDRHSVFGRVRPEQKRAMVQALQSRGHVVAMTGDGINDALALKTADLGIAVGNGAPATKAVARLILLDGRFATLPAVVAEGRRVIANIERVSHLFLAKTTYAFLLGLAFGALAWQFPFVPRQLSTSDFIVIGFPAAVLALMPNLRRYRPGLLGRALRTAVPSGVVMAAVILAVYAVGHGVLHAEPEDIDSAAFGALVATGLWVLGVAARPFARWTWALMAAMVLSLVAVFAVPQLREYHELELPDPGMFAATLAVCALGCGMIEAAHHLISRRAPNREALRREAR
ncbi:magnesium-transporting ATPase [Sinomonas cyclohexanicum]|uniref:Magnesium-transporting ATPase n=1 Tax=Sinomonas cyclohexanicum TaxID=322009 RepID=A0ABM7PR73_SINCY|nr:HAD-IC family P-type ATPase [Corynebacterium cyclohexanicum]BCT74697.1 magnesium-transporting ATPase [Corynebacterium cyclohexanicum]